MCVKTIEFWIQYICINAKTSARVFFFNSKTNQNEKKMYKTNQDYSVQLLH